MTRPWIDCPTCATRTSSSSATCKGVPLGTVSVTDCGWAGSTVIAFFLAEPDDSCGRGGSCAATRTTNKLPKRGIHNGTLHNIGETPGIEWATARFTHQAVRYRNQDLEWRGT